MKSRRSTHSGCGVFGLRKTSQTNEMELASGQEGVEGKGRESKLLSEGMWLFRGDDWSSDEPPPSSHCLLWKEANHSGQECIKRFISHFPAERWSYILLMAH